MPIPLRPIEPAATPMRGRRREALPVKRAALVVEATPSPQRVPFRLIRRESELAVAGAVRVSENDGWPCLPYTER